MNVPVTLLYVWPMDAAVDGTMKGLVSERFDSIVPADRIARPRRWDTAEVTRLRKHPSIPVFDGPGALSMTFDNIDRLSMMRARHWIEAILIAPLSPVWPVNTLGRIIGRPECDVRRMQKRAIELGLLVRDEAGQLRRPDSPNAAR